MIFDTLSDAQLAIVRVLVTNPNVYTGDAKTRIEKLVEEMDAVRSAPGLGCPLNWPQEPVRRSIAAIKAEFIQNYL